MAHEPMEDLLRTIPPGEAFKDALIIKLRRAVLQLNDRVKELEKANG